MKQLDKMCLKKSKSYYGINKCSFPSLKREIRKNLTNCTQEGLGPIM